MNKLWQILFASAIYQILYIRLQFLLGNATDFEPFEREWGIEKTSTSSRPTSAVKLNKTEWYSSCLLPENETIQLPTEPTFVIAGTQKGGTSALAGLLEYHPGLLRSRRFEVHAFSGAHMKNIDEMDPTLVCQKRNKYITQEWDMDALQPIQGPRNLIAYEKTPVYMATPKTAALMKQVIPWTKIIIMLRNPVDRMYSAYKMSRVTDKNDISFETQVEADMQKIYSYNLSNAPTLEEFYKDPTAGDFSIPAGLSIYDRFDSLPRYMHKNSLYRGCYYHQLIQWLKYFGHNVRIHSFEYFEQNRQKVLDDILEFVGASPFHLTDEILQDDHSPYERSFDEPMSNKTRAYLEHFFEPYNAELRGMLGDKWEDTWISGKN